MKKTISKKEIEHISLLANLPLKNSEVEKFARQLSEVIDYNISLLEKIKTENVLPTAHVTGASNIRRADETQPGLSPQEALQNTKSKHNGFFKVKPILPRG